MGVKMREYRDMVAREIENAGGQVVEFGTNGRGHQTVAFQIDGREGVYNFPTSGHTNGCGLMNGRANLRRIIRDLTQTNPITPPNPEEDTLLHVEIIEQPAVINKALRKRIADRYLELETVRDVMAEFDIEYDEAVRALKLAGGRAAKKVKEEIALRVQLEKAIPKILVGEKAVLPKRFDKLVRSEMEKRGMCEGEETVEETVKEPVKKRSGWEWRNDVTGTYEKKFPGVIVSEAEGRFQIDIPCAGCGEVHEAAFTSEQAEPPYKVKRLLREAGWKLGDTTNIYNCGLHTNKGDAPSAAEPPVTADDLGQVVQKQAQEPAQSATVMSAAELRAARRAVVEWLNEFFDLERNCYKAGMSDNKIALEVGLQEREITAIREDLYGPLGPPEEVVKLMEKIVEVESSITALTEAFTQQRDEMAGEIASLRQRVEQYLGNYAETNA